MEELTVVSAKQVGDGVYTGQLADTKGTLYGFVANIEVHGNMMAPAHEPSRDIRLYDAAGTIVPPSEVRNGAQRWQLTPGKYCRIETRAGGMEVIEVTVNTAEEVTLTKFRKDEYPDLPAAWRQLLPAIYTHP